MITDNFDIIIAKKGVSLSSGFGTVFLPSPEFSDQYKLIANVNVKRSISGIPYTYIKIPPAERLEYKFQLKRSIAINLKAFLIASMNQHMTLVNFNSEVWSVRLVNDTMDFTSIGRGDVCDFEYQEVSLEFEGTLLTATSAEC